jgi:DNA-binding transcriptional ArsR family regulator
MLANPAAIDLAFAAVAHPVRRRVLERLARRDHSVSELVALFDISQPAVTKHLNQLEAAGLIARRKVGRQRLCSLRPRGLRASSSWMQSMETLWTKRLDMLDALLTTSPAPGEDAP